MIQLMQNDAVMKTQASLPFGERNGEKGFEQEEPEAVMVYEEEFAKLEQFVERLIDSYNDLKTENSSLRERLAEVDQQNMQNKDLVNNLQNDRTIMLERVTHLISKIEDWEKSHDSVEDTQDVLNKQKTGSKAAATSDQTFSLAVE